MLNRLEVRVRKTILEHEMLSGGERVLVAVSGGADSTALLLCLHSLASEFRLSLAIAHLNHCIRGPEADDDQDFVRRVSTRLGLEFISETIDVKQQAAAQRQNLEEYARTVRYGFLRRAADQAGAQKIAVGHNLNDQAETALFRFIRGSGIEGLSSIYPVLDGVVIRPLLDCSRGAILEYLKLKGAEYREDSTNRDFRYTRNRIRRELFPYLERNFNPQLTRALVREAGLARETWSFIESEARKVLESVISRTDESIRLNVGEMLRVHPALQKEVLRQALKEYLGSLHGIRSSHINSILSLCRVEQSGAQIQLPRNHIVLRQFDTLVFKRTPPPNPSFSYRLDIPGRCFVPEVEAAFISSPGRAPDLQIMKSASSTQAFLEPSAVPEQLTIRSRIPGDRYGGPGHRKVKKLLINNRIPLPDRSVLPMIVAGTDVVWIPGFRPARTYEARPGSPACVVIEMRKEP